MIYGIPCDKNATLFQFSLFTIFAIALDIEFASGRIGNVLVDGSDFSIDDVTICTCFWMTYCIDVKTSMWGPIAIDMRSSSNKDRAEMV
jgi:hypothetical protein